MFRNGAQKHLGKPSQKELKEAFSFKFIQTFHDTIPQVPTQKLTSQQWISFEQDHTRVVKQFTETDFFEKVLRQRVPALFLLQTVFSVLLVLSGKTRSLISNKLNKLNIIFNII
jgi:hypothetical protein